LQHIARSRVNLLLTWADMQQPERLDICSSFMLCIMVGGDILLAHELSHVDLKRMDQKDALGEGATVVTATFERYALKDLIASRFKTDHQHSHLPPATSFGL
jgi:hypothetical protein